MFWALVAALGLARVEVAGRVLAVLTAAEIIIVLVETISGLARPAGGHLDFGALSPSTMTAAGAGTGGVLAVIALTGFVGFEQSPVLSEEARNPRRTIPAATYTAVAAAALLYAAAAWAMAVHAGRSHVVAAAAAQGPAMLYTLTSSGALAQTAQLLFMTLLFASALSYHNVTWRYMFSLSREGVLPAALSRTSRNSIPRAACITQSASGLVVIGLFAIFGWPPMTGLFFGGGATGGLGVMILLAITSAGIVRYFDRVPGAASVWTRMTAPALSALLLAGAVVLAIMHYGTLLGTARGNPAAWLLPSAYGVAAAAGLAWGIVLKRRRPGVYATIGLGHWLIADRTARCEIFPRYFRMYVVHAMTDGLVYTTPDRIAAALWIPGTGPAEPPGDYDEERAEVTGQWAERFVIFDGELDAHHLDGVAHYHLAILAVRPDWQGRGVGTALLDAHHAVLDQEGTAAYLEASDERTRGIYLRYGYTDYGSPIQLPDGPPMYPMTREPRGGGG